MGILAAVATFLGLQGLTGCGSTSSVTCISLTTSTDGQEVALNNPTYGGDELAQSFVATTAATVSAVRIKLKRVGALQSDSVRAYVVPDDAGQPTAITGSEPYGELTITSAIPTTTNFTSYTLTLSSTVALTANSTYWIRIKGAYTQSGSDYLMVAANNSNIYTNGSAAYEGTTPNSFGTTIIGATRDLNVGLTCR